MDDILDESYYQEKQDFYDKIVEADAALADLERTRRNLAETMDSVDSAIEQASAGMEDTFANWASYANDEDLTSIRLVSDTMREIAGL